MPIRLIRFSHVPIICGSLTFRLTATSFLPAPLIFANRLPFTRDSFGLIGLNQQSLIALSICQNWPARPVNLQRKCNNLEELLGDNPSHSSGEVYIILEKCKFEGPVELVLPNVRSGRSVLSNGKRPKAV